MKIDPAAWAIDATGIEKTFTKKRSIGELVKHPFRAAERVRALNGVELKVRQGEIFGLLGPNGAGKTTLLKVLSCLILPDKGRARILGLDTVHETRVKRRLGLVHSDERSFYWRLSARENLRFFARLYDLPSGTIDAPVLSCCAAARASKNWESREPTVLVGCMPRHCSSKGSTLLDISRVRTLRALLP